MFSRTSQLYLNAIALVLIFFSQTINANSPPELSIKDQQVNEGEVIEITVAPRDADGVVPSVYMKSGPPGATLNDNGDGTRKFQWIANTAGSFTAEFVVTDAQDENLRQQHSVSIVVTEKNSDSTSAATIEPVPVILEPQQVVITSSQNATSELPAYLNKVNEPNHDTQLIRITKRGLFGFENNSATHRYSKRQAWNSNETLLEVDHKILDAHTFEILHDYIPLGNERAWSTTAPNVMLGIAPHNGKYISLAYHDFSNNKTSTVRNFDEYQHCTMGDGEGNPSNNGAYVLIVCNLYPGGPATALSIELPAGKVLGRTTLESDYNWAGFSQSGQNILVEYSVLGNSNFRLVRYSPDLKQPSLFLNHDVSHGDFGIDTEGNDVYVMIDHTGIYYKRLHDGFQVHIGSTNTGVGQGFGHVSCRNVAKSGWCFYSSSDHGSIGEFELSYQKPLSTKWVNGVQWHEGNKNFVHWGIGRSSASHYDAHPKASVSPSGTQLIYSSDWFGQTDVHSFVYQHMHP